MSGNIFGQGAEDAKRPGVGAWQGSPLAMLPSMVAKQAQRSSLARTALKLRGNSLKA